MNLYDEVRKLADANGDGKINKDDVEKLREQYPDQGNVLDKVKAAADTNDDGKIGIDDLQQLNLGELLGDAKSLFGDKK